MRRPLCLATASLVAATVLLPVSARAAASVQQTTIRSGSKAVTTTSGKTLHLLVVAQKTVVGGTFSSSDVTVTFATGGDGSAAYGEQHSWKIPLTGDPLQYPTTGGGATLSTGTETAPFGRMHLTYTPSSAPTPACGDGVSSTSSGTLVGGFHFDTMTTGWGKVSRKSITFPNAGLTDFRTNSCSPAPTTKCVSGLEWTGPDSTPYLAGVPAGKHEMDEVKRTVDLTSPTGAQRIDRLASKVALPTIHNGTVTVTTGGAFSGAATISGGIRMTNSGPCTKNGQTFTLTDVDLSNDDWLSPNANRFTAHFQVTPDYQPPHSGNESTYDKISYV